MAGYSEVKFYFVKKKKSEKHHILKLLFASIDYDGVDYNLTTMDEKECSKSL